MSVLFSDFRERVVICFEASPLETSVHEISWACTVVPRFGLNARPRGDLPWKKAVIRAVVLSAEWATSVDWKAEDSGPEYLLQHQPTHLLIT